MRPRLLLPLLIAATCSWSEEPAPAPATEPAPAATSQPAKHPLHYATGTVVVGDQLGTIELPADYRYLQAKHARFVVEQLWGNPPDPSVLGLVVPPAQQDVFD